MCLTCTNILFSTRVIFSFVVTPKRTSMPSNSVVSSVPTNICFIQMTVRQQYSTRGTYAYVFIIISYHRTSFAAHSDILYIYIHTRIGYNLREANLPHNLYNTFLTPNGVLDVCRILTVLSVLYNIKTLPHRS